MSARAPARTPAYYALKEEIEEFLYHEAELLDERRFGEWLDVLADDLVYFMPLRRNVRFGEHAERENTRFGKDISWFEEDKWTLTKRVEQIQTGIHWAEEPLSRVCHLVTNIRLAEIVPSAEATETVVVRSRFIVYVNRVQTETDLHVGKRTDTLRRVSDGWRIARRELILDQNVLLSKNLTVFF
jgi:3-phenylpropionate/cinnamic acid dioxygenase small subunit